MTTIQLRRGTAAGWTAQNPILADGERGVEKDTGREKSGDGVTRWNNLPYFLENSFAPIFTPERFGVCPGDSTDVSTPFLAAVAAAQGFGGRVELQPGKNYRLDACLANPYTGTATPVSKPVRITSPGASSENGRWPSNAKNGGATIDLRYDGTDGLHPAKIDTRGAGKLEIDHINIVSGGTDNFPILQTTNTTVHLHHNFVQGNTANSGSSCVQDAFILGGTSIIIDNGANAPFQGYGSVIHDNFFDHIRRGVVARAYCNSVPIERNTFSTSCGNDGSGGGTIALGTANLGAAIEFLGNATAGFVVGNITRGNTIECVHYKYGIAASWATANTFGPDGIWDPSTGYVAAHYFDPSAVYNQVNVGYANDNYPKALDSGLTNRVEDHAQARFSFQSQATMYRTSTPPQVFTTASGVGWQALVDSGDAVAMVSRAGGIGPPSYPECVLQTTTGTSITDLVTTAGSDVVSSASSTFTRQHQYAPIKSTGNITAHSVIIRYIDAHTVQISTPALTSNPGGVSAQYGNGTTGGGTAADEVGFSRRHIISKGAIGSAAATAALGTGATATAVGTDTAFTLTLVTGSGSMATGNLCSVGAGVQWAAAAKVVLTPKNLAAAIAMQTNQIYCTNTTSNFFLACGVALPTGTTLIFDVHMVA